MKRIFLILLAVVAVSGAAQAQDFKFGPKVGLISSNTSVKSNLENVKTGSATFGVQAGVFSRISILGFFVQPEVLFTSTGSQVNLNDTDVNQILEYKYNRLDVPVLVGKRFLRIVRVQAGVVGSMMLNVDIKDFDAEAVKSDLLDSYQKATFGYQAGIGVDLGKLSADLRYEGSFSKFKDSITIPGTAQTFAADQRPNQLIFSVGYSLF